MNNGVSPIVSHCPFPNGKEGTFLNGRFPTYINPPSPHFLLFFSSFFISPSFSSLISSNPHLPSGVSSFPSTPHHQLGSHQYQGCPSHHTFHQDSLEVEPVTMSDCQQHVVVTCHVCHVNTPHPRGPCPLW